MASWKLPLIVAAIAVPIAVAFILGGAAVGAAAGALVAATVVFLAVRQRPRGPLGPVPGAGGRRVLIVVTCPLEEPAAVRRLAAEVGLDGGDGDGSVMVLSPARIGFLDRWASDVEESRQRAQECLVASVAALAKAGIAAEARVGDEDVVQAVEDQLGSFPASEVVLVSAGGEDEALAAAAEELRSRLRIGFRRVVLDGGG